MRTNLSFSDLAALAAVLFPLACGGSTLPSATEPLSGSGLVYSLASVENKALPATVALTPDVNVLVERGKLTLSPDSTWIMSHVVSTSPTGGSGTSVVTLRGSYRRAGTAISLSQQSVEAFVGTFSETAVSLTNKTTQMAGTSFSYTR